MFNGNDYKIFNYFALFWLIIAWVAFIITLANFFYWWVFVFIIFIGIFILFKKTIFLKYLFKTSKTFIITNLILLSVIILFSFFSSPTIFSGRDQGSISQSSIRLAQFHQLEFSTSASKTFFDINSSISKNKFAECLKNDKARLKKTYCEIISASKALNFPGFYYTIDGNLITQFPLAYISWLATFYTFFGLSGLIIANALLFYIFVFSFLFILQNIIPTNNQATNKYPLITSITLSIVLTSFSFMWFFKFTLTENMMLSFLWLAILQVLILTKTFLKEVSDKKLSFFIILLSSALLIFVRIEGILFFGIMLTLLFLHNHSKQYLHQNFRKIILPFLIILGFVFVWNFKVDIYFYKAIVKAFTKDLIGSSLTLSNTGFLFPLFNLLKIFILYGLFFPLILGLFKVLFLFKKKQFQLLVPFFIIAPIFIYLFNPQITPDHPWMLRRFVFAILPISILYTMLFINDLFQKRKKMIVMLIFFIIISCNLYSFISFLTFRPTDSLQQETRTIKQEFTNNDLILVDRMAGGDNWNMITGPMDFLFQKNAAYLFNPNDIAVISTKNYAKIYLITSNEKINYYKSSSIGNSLIFIKNYTINSTILYDNSLNNTSLPKIKTITTKGAIFEIQK